MAIHFNSYQSLRSQAAGFAMTFGWSRPTFLTTRSAWGEALPYDQYNVNSKVYGINENALYVGTISSAAPLGVPLIFPFHGTIRSLTKHQWPTFVSYIVGEPYNASLHPWSMQKLMFRISDWANPEVLRTCHYLTSAFDRE